MAQPNLDVERLNIDQMHTIARQAGVSLLSSDQADVRREFARKVLQHSLNLTVALKDWVVLVGMPGSNEKIIYTGPDADDCDAYIAEVWDRLVASGSALQ